MIDAQNPNAIVYVSDAGFLAPSLISALSFERAGGHGPCDIVIILTDPQWLTQAQDWLGAQGSSVRIVHRPVSGVEAYSLLGHLSPTAYGRLFLDRWLPDSYSRVLYLDGDTLAGPEPIDFAQDLGGRALGVCSDLNVLSNGRVAALRRQIGLPEAGRYFNSGVLLLDWARWRDGAFSARTFAVLAEQPELPFGDQCALNIACDGAAFYLPVDWNCQTALIDDRAAQASARVMHFTGGVKPWHLDRWKHAAKYGAPYRILMPDMPFQTGFRPATIKARAQRALRPVERSISRRRKPVLERADVPTD